jgi:hypothetical protein
MKNKEKIEDAIQKRLKIRIVNKDTPIGEFTLFHPYAIGTMVSQPGDHIFGLVENTYTEGEKNYYRLHSINEQKIIELTEEHFEARDNWTSNVDINDFLIKKKVE